MVGDISIAIEIFWFGVFCLFLWDLFGLGFIVFFLVVVFANWLGWFT